MSGTDDTTKRAVEVLEHMRNVSGRDTYNVSVSGPTVGAFAVGDHAVATGHVTVGAPDAVTQEQHKAAIKEAQKALVDDEDQCGPLVHDALGQFLRVAREVQVEQQSIANVQAKMKETLDEVWAQQAAKGLRPLALPEGLKVIGELAKIPVMSEVVKALLRG